MTEGVEGGSGYTGISEYSAHHDLVGTFRVERLSSVRSGGGWEESWDHEEYSEGILADARSREINQALSRGESVSHTLLVRGETAARYKDRLILQGAGASADRRHFYVTGKENPGNLGRFALLYLNEDDSRGDDVP